MSLLFALVSISELRALQRSLCDAEKRERNEKPTTVVPLLGYEQMNKVDGRRDEDYDMMIGRWRRCYEQLGHGREGRHGCCVCSISVM